LPPAELALLNLGFRRGMTAPNGPHRVLVPAEHADRLARELSRVRPVQFAERRRYRIREGDTLSMIAQAHGTTVKTLMAANRLDSHLIRVGRDLMIPVSGRTSSEPVAAAEQGMHVVSRGESLWLIARLYRTTVSSLRDWNRLAPGSNLLHPGQQLRVRGEG
jgi:membrane-bound lytic murein transglycosylase D